MALLIFITISSCESNTDNEPAIVTVAQSEGYELMTQKCYICHLETPDRSKRDSMLAPPMLRVQEHYKPSYPNKKDFIDAVVKWVLNPVVDSTLMPGAVRKFKVMPKLYYNEAEVRLIAEAMYDYDFGNMPKHKGIKSQKLQMNNGEKWIVNASTTQSINEASQLLREFDSDDIRAYNQLGRDIFNHAKAIMLDESYTEELFEQLHYFFASMEENMHQLMATNSIDDAEKQCEILRTKLDTFNQYFEEK